MSRDGELTVTAKVRNTSDRDGVAVVQLYTHDVAARIARPVKELKDFARVALAAGEEKQIAFTLKPDQLKFHDGRQWLLEPGKFEVMLGFSSADETAKLSFVLE